MTQERRRIVITSPVLVVVEGPDEQRFYEALCTKHQIGPCQFEAASGKDDIRPSIRAFALAPGRENLRAVGIIRDGDDDPDRAFASAADALACVEWPRPIGNMLITAGTPSTGVAIVRGNLDTLCMEAATKSCEARSVCVNGYLDCLRTAVGEPAARHKAWVHAFLAGFGKGDVRVGEGAKRGCWPLDSVVFGDIRQFLTDLAGRADPQVRS